MKKILFAILIFSSLSIIAQDKKEEPKFGIKFSGFVKTDAFYDTRQTVTIREGHFLLYPDNISLDANKNDINARSNFNILSIQSRLKGSIFGPDACGAKTSGVIEADFFGNENASFSDVNGFRLRHAFVKLNWKSAELMIGQYWHPMLIAESFPGVISFNTGAPFQPFSRNPQIRFSKSFGGLKLIVCAYSQRDFTSIGPEYTLTAGKYTSTAVASSKYARNAGVPDAHFQLQYKSDSSNVLAGAGVDYKTLVPELFTVNNGGTNKYKSDQTITSLSAFGFVNVKLKPINIKLEGVYAQNAYDMVMIGGYGVKEITDTATGAKVFTNLNTASIWVDFQTNGKKIQFGLFGGYSKNMGSNDSIKGAIYARGSNIDYLYRVAPRVVFISGKLSIALEGEYTFAMYGTANGNKKGLVTNTKAVDNTRILLAFIYNF
jgi:hypothetical protein